MAQKSATRALIEKLFDGSTELLLTRLVTKQTLSDESVTRIRQLLDRETPAVDRKPKTKP